MKLGHIVKYHDVFFKFDNGPYRTMLSVVMALCFMKIHNFKRCLLSMSNIFYQNSMKLGYIVRYVMSSSSLIMVHIAPCFQQLWSFVYGNSSF